MSDRLAQLRSLADGVGDLQHGQPGDKDHCTAADVIRWAVAEIERNGRDHQKNAAESSVASAGSVAGEPAAWGVLRVGGRWVSILDNEVQAETSRKSFDQMEDWVHEVVPLYRSPTLTDAEREAVARGAELADHAGEHSTTAAALRGLLERNK